MYQVISFTAATLAAAAGADADADCGGTTAAGGGVSGVVEGWEGFCWRNLGSPLGALAGCVRKRGSVGNAAAPAPGLEVGAAAG